MRETVNSHAFGVGGRLRESTRVAAVPALMLAMVAAMLGFATTPAGAATTPRDVPYLMFSSAFGTKLSAPQLGVSSGPSAYASIGCAHRIPLTYRNDVAGVSTGVQGVTIGAVTSTARTFRDSQGNTISRGISDVADVAVGNDQLKLEVKALHGVSSAWVGPRGVFHAGSTLQIGDLALSGSALDSATADSPLGQVGGLLNGAVGPVLDLLKSGQSIQIPGLGEIEPGTTAKAVNSSAAQAGTVALVIDLYADPNQTAPSAADTRVVVGRSFARIGKYDFSGVFGGEAYGAQATLLDGVAHVGENVRLPLRCNGTAGKVITESLAALNLANQNQLQLGALQSRVYAVRGTPKGGATAWTASKVLSVNAGNQLKIDGISVVAKVVRDSNGHLHRSVYRNIGAITAGGKTYPAPSPGNALTIPGVATIAAPAPVTSTTGIAITGLRITLFSGTAGNTVVNLANARVNTHR
jgi:hypothetical protein